MRTEKILGILCGIFGILLITVIVREHYISRILHRFFTPNKAAEIENLTARWQNSEEYAEWNKQMDSIHGTAPIVFLGDSQTSRGNWEHLLCRLDLVNMGIPGDITPAMQNRVTRVVNLKPRICFLQSGVNDINVGIPVDSTVQALDRIARRLRAHGIAVVLHTVSYTSAVYNERNPINPQIDRLNQRIREMARTGNIPLIDMNRYTESNGSIDARFVRSDDGLHYSFEAYCLWGRYVTELLKTYGI